jgi:uncharacterized RDD family membrane protein YckC
MARWRDIKNKKQKTNKTEANPIQDIQYAPILTKIKSFITDMFMLMMPLSYFTTYFILDGKNDFQSNELARWGVSLMFGIVNMIFWSKTGQTPGYKAYEIKIVDSKTMQNITFFQGIIRYMVFIISYSLLIGMVVPFFTKNRQSLHDILSGTCVIMYANEPHDNANSSK